MATIRQERGVPIVAATTVYIGRIASSRRHTLNSNSAVGSSKYNDVVTIPGSTAGIGRVTQRLGRATASGDLFELSLSKKTDPTIVWRPEGICRALSKWHRLSLKSIQGTQPELLFSIHGGRNYQQATIRGNREAMQEAAGRQT